MLKGPKFKDKVWLQSYLKPKTTTLTEQINIATYFENLIIEFHGLFVLKTHVKFHVNQMLFTIWFINLNFYVILDYKNSKFKDLIDDIIIDIWYFWIFVSTEYIRKKCNSMVDLSKFISNKRYWVTL